MPYEHDPIGHIEHKLAIDEATQAADAVGLIADADMRRAQADLAGRNATTDADRLAADLDHQEADLAAIRALSASSRAEWELARMTDPE